MNYIDDGCGILKSPAFELYEGVAENFSSMNLATVRFPGGFIIESRYIPGSLLYSSQQGSM